MRLALNVILASGRSRESNYLRMVGRCPSEKTRDQIIVEPPRLVWLHRFYSTRNYSSAPSTLLKVLARPYRTDNSRSTRCLVLGNFFLPTSLSFVIIGMGSDSSAKLTRYHDLTLGVEKRSQNHYGM